MWKDHKKLKKLRKQVDVVDSALVATLGRRMKLVQEIGKYKRTNRLNSFDKKRWQQVLKTRVAVGQSKHLSSELVKKIFKLIHTYSLSIQRAKK